MSGDGKPRQAIVTVGRPLYGGLSEASTEDVQEAGPVQLDVPFSIAGERVQVTFGASSRKPVPATLDDILHTSPDRVEPRCVHFGACGGCQYQHMSDALQVQTKANLLRQLLASAGVPAPEPHLHTAEPWAYRNRVRLRVRAGSVGYSRRGSHEFLPIHECPIVSPLLWRAAKFLDGLAADVAVPWPAATVEVELFANSEDNALQLAVHVDADVPALDRAAPAAFRAVCSALHTAVPELRGGGLLARGQGATAASRRVQERQRVEVARWGEAGLTYTVSGHDYAVSRGAFFQVNRFLTDTLVDLVIGQRSGEFALDLFAGAGLFSLPLTGRFRRVLAVEIGQPAASDLDRALQAQGPQHRTMPQTTLAFLKSWRPALGVPDLVVMDPPRAGLGSDAIRELLRLDAPEIVYVSCDPTTFAREARSLVDSRYAVAELHMVDLFPQTFHLETVAVFRRR